MVGKAAGLRELEKAGARVPKYCVLKQDAMFSENKETSSAWQRIQADSERLNSTKEGALRRGRANRLRRAIGGLKLSGLISGSVDAWVESASPNTLTIARSCAQAEDGSEASFAGIYKSIVCRTVKSEILDSIREVVCSYYSEAAVEYRHQLRLDQTGPLMDVIIQEFVPGQVSGVLFGIAPNVPSQDALLIEACLGLGLTAVQGGSVDQYVLSRTSGKLCESVIATKKDQWLADKSSDGCLKRSPVPTDQARYACLDRDALSALFQLFNAVRQVSGDAIDMEWTFVDGELFALQARPMTEMIIQRAKFHV